MSKQSHASKTPSSAAPAPSRRPVIEPAPALETPAAGLALEVAADHLSPPLAQRAIQQLGYVHGNRQLSRRVSVVQRHPGHGDEPPLQRAILMADPTQIATVNVAAAPLPLRRSRRGPASRGNLAAGDTARILEQQAGQARLHVETGALRGQIGWAPLASLTVAGAATSQRTPAVGAENAYTQLQTELARVPPNRNTILFIIQTRLTPAQRLQLLQAGNVEYAQMQGLAALTANDLLHILGLLGAPLLRKIRDYLAKGGNTAAQLQLAFATANYNERLQVAQDEPTVGLLIPLLGAAHPETLFGTELARLYPRNGRIATLAATRPFLAAWLAIFAGPGVNIRAAAEQRAGGLRAALARVNSRGAAAARAQVLAAVNAAPRGQAMSTPERAALDQLELKAYAAGVYTSADLGVMFLARWGRPFVNAGAQPKTFIHRLWRALFRIPSDHILLNNVLDHFAVNANPAALGSFMDYLSSGTFGELLSNPPVAETVHATGRQNSNVITVIEPTLDLLTAGQQVTVREATGVNTPTPVTAINVPARQLTLGQAVNVRGGAPITPAGANTFNESAALRLTSRATFYGSAGGAPNLANVLGTLEPGNLFARMSQATVGRHRYIFGGINAGPLAGTGGWIRASTAEPLRTGVTMGQETFEWTARHEMGHSLDLQYDGFSRFSASSAARWIKYPDANNWLTALIAQAAIATPDTAATYFGITRTFRQAAGFYAQAVQSGTAASANAVRAQRWLQGWAASAGGSLAVYNVVTQFNASPNYFMNNNLGLPALGGRIFGAHYGEWFSAAAAARNESLAVGISPYAYTCTYEFFADHYAAYTSPGTGAQRYSRAVPGWARNFFDRLVGETGAGPTQGMERHRMA